MDDTYDLLQYLQALEFHPPHTLHFETETRTATLELRDLHAYQIMRLLPHNDGLHFS